MKIIAHRGDASSHPENTLAAFEAAFDRGADGVEMDIQLGKSGIVVVHNMSRANDPGLPFFKDVIKAIAGRGPLEVEIKAFTTDILDPLAEILSQYPDEDIKITSSEIPLLPHIRKRFSQHPLGIIMHEWLFGTWMNDAIVRDKIIGWGKMTGATCVHIPYEIVANHGKKQLMQAIHDEGSSVHVHIPKSAHQSVQFDTIYEWGADSCTVDDLTLVARTNTLTSPLVE